MPIRAQISPEAAAGDGEPMLVIAGPCVLGGEAEAVEVARTLKKFCTGAGFGFVFKASFDKANRTSGTAERGPGLDAGLKILDSVKKAAGVPVTTDIHLPEHAMAVAETVDMLQIPAFLCRQTDLLVAAGATGRAVNVKKGQFMSPDAMKHAVDKVRSGGSRNILLTERGTTFGYHNLVVDMRSMPAMRAHGVPVIIDATHSVQRPAALGDATGGDRAMVPAIMLAAVAAGADGVFAETLPDPGKSPSDGENMLPLAELPALLAKAGRVYDILHGD
ncbi:MAG: 3-deoxy-8-phosphooctulonate synthase [Planctomycetes bacterium]|nr:3-deoxy-8-phosphooctulonate synthase [Planctomycetota bacterium]